MIVYYYRDHDALTGALQEAHLSNYLTNTNIFHYTPAASVAQLRSYSLYQTMVYLVIALNS